MGEGDPLAHAPFAYRTLKGGRVQISCNGTAVSILAGREAVRFLAQVEGAVPSRQQLHMAKATGQFKRGNERVGKYAGHGQ